jgi:thiol-disulfide isomerase/thioredoxin
MEEKMINVTKWQVGDNTLTSYTALWCGPCKRVKPDVLKYMESFEKKALHDIPKSEFKKNIGEFIPLFKIHDKESYLLNETQSSDFKILEKVFDEHFSETKNSENITNKSDKFELNEDF